MSCTCTQCWGGFIELVPPLVRLRTPDGGYVYLEWHNYLGPTFYRDRAGTRALEPDEGDPIWEALQWWIDRGRKG